MSVSLEILNNNNSYRTTTAATAKSVKAAESKPVSIPVEENAEKSVPNVDSFVHGGGNAKYGAYSKTIAMKNNGAEAASAASKVQAKGAKGASNVYLDVITNKAAKKAGLAVNPSNGQIIVNNSSDARKVSTYQKEVNRIHGAFWCQTGGWSNLYGDGSSGCARTASATMASINTNYTITPNQTTASSGNNLSGIRVNGKDYSFTDQSYYNMNQGADAGLNRYTFGSEKSLLDAVNNELRNGRSVVVETTSGGGHWVTVTGTRNGKDAKSFNDLMGVDPWYNGGNSHNPSSGTGSGSNNPNRAGVIRLSDVANQNLNPNYRIITFKQ